MRTTLVLASLILLVGCQKAPKTAALAPTYDSAAVETRKIEVTVDASGVVEPESTVEVKSKASGEVLKVRGETGEVVEAGTLLVQIDKRTPANIVSQSESALKAAEARRAIAETQLKRAEALYRSQTLTQADVEKAQLEFANADAQVVSSKVALENARITLEDTDVRAPITGTIIEKTVEPGIVITSPTQAVSGGTILMKMADLNSVQVRTRVDETDIGKIRPGLPTKVLLLNAPASSRIQRPPANGRSSRPRPCVISLKPLISPASETCRKFTSRRGEAQRSSSILRLMVREKLKPQLAPPV